MHYFDETVAFTNVMRPCGWSPRAERCPGYFPLSHRNTNTLIAALSPEEIVARMILDGPLDSASFRVRSEQVLVPELREDDVVVCDNVPMHKIAGISKVIEAAGAKLFFLPPCRQGLSPIEKTFSQIKSHLRKKAARTKRKLNHAIASATALATPGIAVNYYASRGYQSAST